MSDVGGSWHYTDKDGRRQEELFTKDQVTLDQSVIKAFQGLEADFGNKKPLDPKSVQLIFEASKMLPPERAKHHMAEMARIGVQPPAAKKETKDEKPASSGK